MKIASLPQAKLNISVQRNGQPYISGNGKNSFSEKLEEAAQKNNDTAAGSLESGVNALIRLGISSRAEGMDSKGEWRSVLFQFSDMDHDGSVTQAEMQQSIVAGGGNAEDANVLYDFLDQFASPDSPREGLTVNNFKHGMATSSLNGGFKAVLSDFLDTNGDGEISADELDAQLNELRKKPSFR